MDIFNFAKAVEQGIYDVMMWIFFYPYTLIRTLLFPAAMLAYVSDETSRDPDDAFAAAMRPAILMFISIAIGTFVAPFSVGQIHALQTTHIGRVLVDSWFALVLYRIVVFSLFPLAGAVLFDLLTPGRLSRISMRRPFYMQCYICAPFALIASPLMVNFSHDSTYAYIAFVLVTIWFLAVQFVFFRTHAGQRWYWAALLSPAVLVLGLVGLITLGTLATLA